jgi:uncharacterized membrane protein
MKGGGIMEENMNPNSQPEQSEGMNQQPEMQKPTEPEMKKEPESNEGNSGNNGDIQENKAIAILSYIGILCLVPLLAKKESRFAQFHAKQGLVLFIVEIIGMFLMPLFGLGALINLAALVFSVIGIINVAGGKMSKLPIVGDLAEKFNL